jgi:hypothetical protein
MMVGISDKWNAAPFARLSTPVSADSHSTTCKISAVLSQNRRENWRRSDSLAPFASSERNGSERTICV